MVLYLLFDVAKTALEMLTLYYASRFRKGWDKRGNGIASGIEWKINITCPGPTRIERQTVDIGARKTVRLATLGADGETGTMSGLDGVLPW